MLLRAEIQRRLLSLLEVSRCLLNRLNTFSMARQKPVDVLEQVIAVDLACRELLRQAVLEAVTLLDEAGGGRLAV